MAQSAKPESPSGFCTTRLLGVDTVGIVGPATVVTVSKLDEQFLDVVVNGLPAPSDFGADMTGYTFLLLSPDNGVVVLRQSMIPMPNSVTTWGASAAITGNSLFPNGFILVFASTSDGYLGPEVATGNLADCS